MAEASVVTFTALARSSNSFIHRLIDTRISRGYWHGASISYDQENVRDDEHGFRRRRVSCRRLRQEIIRLGDR